MKQLNILDEKQVVCSGFVTYTQEVIELARKGYTLDVRSIRCPQFMLGLFQCNMLLLEEEPKAQDIATNNVSVQTNKAVEPKEVVSTEASPTVSVTVTDNVVTPVKKAAGRPSKADKAKAELQAKLGDATNSIRGDKQ